MSATTVQVSTSDLLGTAMTAARCAAANMERVRETRRADALRAVAMTAAIEDCVQALAEAVTARPYALSRDPIDVREHDFTAQCDYATERIREAIEVFWS